MTRVRSVPLAALVVIAVSAGVVVACTSSGQRDTATTPTTATPATPDPAPSAATTGVRSATRAASATHAASATPTIAPATAATSTPTAQAIGLEPQVGPLFKAGDTHPHGCTASVVHSPGHDLILTAAHCVTGTGAGQLFAPDYRDGVEPFGTWRVERAWASAPWIASTNRSDDVAVLLVAARTVQGHVDQVEDLVGAETLGTTPSSGTSVEVVGYTQGTDDRQITCTNTLADVAGSLAFSCHGYEGGTSGSPFLTAARPRVIVGLVGGHDQGGCTEAVSYSPPFGAAVRALLARAEAGRAPDSLPTAPNDC